MWRWHHGVDELRWWSTHGLQDNRQRNPTEGTDNNCDSDSEELQEISTDQGIKLGDQYIRHLEQKSFITQYNTVSVYCIQEKLAKENFMKQVIIQDAL